VTWTLLVLPPVDETARRWAERLVEDLPDVEVVMADNEERAAALLDSGVRAAFGTMTPQLLAHAHALEWLQAPMAAPPAGYFFEELASHPVVVTNLRGTYTDHVATHAVALVYALARNLPYYLHRQLARDWAPDKDPHSIVPLQRATILVIGMGGLGVEIARQLAPLGARIVGVDAKATEPSEGVEAIHPPEEIDDLLLEADVVVLTVPHTPKTDRMFAARRFALMKGDAIFVNIGRGRTVDIDDLADALESGGIRAAALDVFPTEPLALDHRLWALPNALLTPHVAAVGPGTDDRRYGVLRENAARFGRGEELINVVDKEAWY
jgi:phosphoglycerate dehydrogenase-like enzyme